MIHPLLVMALLRIGKMALKSSLKHDDPKLAEPLKVVVDELEKRKATRNNNGTGPLVCGEVVIGFVMLGAVLVGCSLRDITQLWPHDNGSTLPPIASTPSTTLPPVTTPTQPVAQPDYTGVYALAPIALDGVNTVNCPSFMFQAFLTTDQNFPGGVANQPLRRPDSVQWLITRKNGEINTTPGLQIEGTFYVKTNVAALTSARLNIVSEGKVFGYQSASPSGGQINIKPVVTAK